MTDTIAIIKGQASYVADIRYGIAKRLQLLVTAARISGQPYTWIIERA